MNTIVIANDKDGMISKQIAKQIKENYRGLVVRIVGIEHPRQLPLAHKFYHMNNWGLIND